MNEPNFLAIGSVIIDDIVYPDGRTSMGVLGGGGTHAAYGMAFAGEKPAVVGLVGADLPAEIRARLEADFAPGGLVVTAQPQVRGWQIFEWDGRRNEIFRVAVVAPFMHQPLAESARVPFQQPRGLTLLRQPDYVAGWRRRFPDAALLWEPTRAFMLSADREAFRAGIAAADIVSPNLHEAQAMYGIADARELLRRLLADGAPIAALRMGEAGSLVARRGSAAAFAIPALPVAEIIDQTGAGNSYCGGFLVGFCRAGDLLTAGAYGAAAASFTLEAVGCPRLPPRRAEQWQRRLQQALQGARGFEL